MLLPFYSNRNFPQLAVHVLLPTQAELSSPIRAGVLSTFHCAAPKLPHHGTPASPYHCPDSEQKQLRQLVDDPSFPFNRSGSFLLVPVDPSFFPVVSQFSVGARNL